MLRRRAAFEVTATASETIAYRWQYRPNATTEWTNIAGTETSPTYSGRETRSLSVANTTTAHNGYQYRCLVSTSKCGSKESNRATLTVMNPLSEITHPSGTRVCPGIVAAFSVTAAGPAVTYQWQQRAHATAQWVNVAGNAGASPAYSGHTTPYLSVSNTALAHNGFQYRCQFIGTSCGIVAGNPAVLTITPLPDITQPVAKNICPGNETAFEVTAVSSEWITYQWQQRSNPTALWANISGTETSPVYSDPATRSLKVSNAVAGHNNYRYRCRLTIENCGTIHSNSAPLTVNQTPAVTHPVPTTVCSGVDSAFQVSVAGSAFTCQWQQRPNAASDWTNISEEGISPKYSDYTSSHLKIQAITSAHNGYQYRARLNSAFCGTSNSNSAMLTVTPPPQITHPSGTTVCSGAEAAFEVTVAGSATYQWQQRATAAATWADISGTETSPRYGDHRDRQLKVNNISLVHNGYQYRCLLIMECGTIAGEPATLTVNTAPAITHPASKNICPDSEIAFEVTVAGSEITTYQWQQRATAATATWVNISGTGTSPGYSDYTTRSLKVSNAAAVHNGYRYRCRLTIANCGTIHSNSGILTVNRAPTIKQPASTRVCSGVEATFLVSAEGADITDYRWQQRTNTAGWADISEEGSAPKYRNYSTHYLKVNNIVSAHGGYGYRCRLTIANCGTLYSNSATLTVNRPPVITRPTPKKICAGSETAFEVAAVSSEITAYQWQQRPAATALWADISGTETSPKYSGHTTRSLKVSNADVAHNSYQYHCRLTIANCGTIYSNPAPLTVNRAPAITHPVDKHVCPGAEAAFQVSAKGPEITAYQWQQRTNAASDWVSISEAGSAPGYSGYTTTHLKVNNISDTHKGYQYRCQFTSAFCGGFIAGNSATLTVTQSVIAPLADRHVCPGKEASFKVSVTPSDCVTGHKWQYRAKVADEWVDISGLETSPRYSGHTTDQLKVNDITATHNGYQYRCRLLLASVAQDIEPAGLYVNPPLEIISHPQDNAVSERNSRAAFRVDAKGNRLSYQWQVSHDQEKNWADIRETGSGPRYEDKTWEQEKLQVNDISASANGYRYRCILSATPCSGETGEKTSNSAKLLWDINTATGDPSPHGEVTLQVYPNPVRHRLNIKLWHSAQGKTTAALYNTAGQKVWSDHTLKNGETLTKEIATGHLPNGLYLLKIVIGSEKPVQTKVVVAN